MSNSVNTNSLLYSALSSLNVARSEVQQAEKRIQTGQRVADASDNAAVFAVSQQIRGDVAAWNEVARAQGPGMGITEVADEGLTQISDLLNRLRSVAIAHSAATGQQATIYANDADAILNQIDKVANAAKFNGLSPLIERDIGSAPPGVATSTPVSGPVNSSGGFGLSTTTYPLPAQAGTVVLRYESYSAPDGFALIYNGGNVANTGGLVSGSGTLTFPYGGGAPNSIDVEVNGGSVGTAWAFTLEFVTPPLGATPPTAEPAGTIQIISDIVGNQTAIRKVDATAQGLGLRPWSISPVATALAAIDYAANLVAGHASHFAERGRQLESVKKVALSTMDAYVTGLGAIVDADIGREQARSMAAKAKTELAIQSVGVANAAQRAVLGFLEGAR